MDKRQAKRVAHRLVAARLDDFADNAGVELTDKRDDIGAAWTDDDMIRIEGAIREIAAHHARRATPEAP